MRTFSTMWKLAVVALGLLATAGAGATGQHQHHGTDQGGKPKLVKPAQKWETDQALRKGMDGIRRSVMAKQAAIGNDRLSSAEYAQLATSVEKDLAYIVENCKLPPDADAALHEAVLLDLIRSGELMRTAKDVSIQRKSALDILQLLHIYGEHFNHPGWELTHASY